MRPPLRIVNVSGFYGDRLEAPAEMLEGGPVDVLTGDWLAELTMIILARARRRDPSLGYARSFLAQLEMVLGTCLERGVRVVSNAGGLAPAQLAEHIDALANRLGLAVRVAWIDGDELTSRLGALRAAGERFVHLETNQPLEDRPVLVASAYQGGWAIAEALARDADVVITGRVADASLVVGPAAWYHGWRRDDWDRLAGALVAGHVLECGTQATGGNFAFFAEVPGLARLGFPIAEIAEDGSCVITKHPGHGGLVSCETITAQLLYEIAGPRYLNPDVVAHLDTVGLEQIGADRVRIAGTRGSAPPPTTKALIALEDGWRSRVTLYLTGLDIEAKAEAFLEALWVRVPPEQFRGVDVRLARTDHEDPDTNERATAALRITVLADDPNRVGRAFGARVTELALASYPGLWAEGLTAQPEPVLRLWPTTIASELVPARLHLDGEIIEVAATRGEEPPAGEAAQPPPRSPSLGAGEPTVRVPLGRLVGARSGDKGGTANIGVWARSDNAWAWLRDFLDVERLASLLPETASYRIMRYELANLRALNFVVTGILRGGAAASTRPDPQAKSLGEWLRARIVEAPVRLLD